jgi:hypothetical protein
MGDAGQPDTGAAGDDGTNTGTGGSGGISGSGGTGGTMDGGPSNEGGAPEAGTGNEAGAADAPKGDGGPQGPTLADSPGCDCQMSGRGSPGGGLFFLTLLAFVPLALRRSAARSLGMGNAWIGHGALRENLAHFLRIFRGDGRPAPLHPSFRAGLAAVALMASLQAHPEGKADPALAAAFEELLPAASRRADDLVGPADRLERLRRSFLEPLDERQLGLGLLKGYRDHFGRRLPREQARWLALQAVSGRSPMLLSSALEASMEGDKPATVAAVPDGLSDDELRAYAGAVLSSHRTRGSALFVAGGATLERLSAFFPSIRREDLLEAGSAMNGRLLRAAALNSLLKPVARKAGGFSSLTVVWSGEQDMTGAASFTGDDPLLTARFLALKDLLAMPLGRIVEAGILEAVASRIADVDA